jgi:hypothetical protein
MSAPNRTAEVAGIVERHRELFGSDESRRGILYHICAELNAIDDGEWGLLRKDDQGGFVPSDIIMWRSSREIFDVLLGGPDRAGWLPLGVVTNVRWVWIAAPPVDVPPEPPPPIEFGDEVGKFLDALERIYDGMAGVAEGLHALDRRLAGLEERGLRMRFK